MGERKGLRRKARERGRRNTWIKREKGGLEGRMEKKGVNKARERGRRKTWMKQDEGEKEGEERQE